ncbi:MAG: hypothetical protein ACFE0P_13895 [Oceanicaulis sp.]
MDDAVMEALKRHLATAETLDVSRFQFVDMDAVRKAAGPIWPDVRARVFLASQSIIERRIAEDDLIIQCATGFLVIYKAVTGEAAEQTTARIKADLQRFFLGERFAELMRVEAVSERLTPAEFQAALTAAGGAQVGPERSAPESAAAATAPGVMQGLVFENAWDVRREAVASFFVSPDMREYEDGPEMSAATVAAAFARPEDRLAFDLDILSRTREALASLLKTGTRCALVAPAGYRALASSRLRAGYVSALAQLSPEMRALLWVRVTGAPADAPAAVIAETGRTLRPYINQLFFDAHLDSATLERAADSEAQWLGARLPGRLTGAVRQDVDRFIAQAVRAGRSVYFHGVENWEMLRYASKTPARLLCGAALGVHDAPRAPYRLTRNGLLARAA